MVKVGWNVSAERSSTMRALLGDASRVAFSPASGHSLNNKPCVSSRCVFSLYHVAPSFAELDHGQGKKVKMKKGEKVKIGNKREKVRKDGTLIKKRKGKEGGKK